MAGFYTSPKEAWAVGDCYSLSVDCNRQDSLKIHSFHCQSGEAFEGELPLPHFPAPNNPHISTVNEHHCLGSWREGNDLFIYTRTDNPNDHACFVRSLQSHTVSLIITVASQVAREIGKTVSIASSGKHCVRGFNFIENVNRTISLSLRRKSTVYIMPIKI